MRALPFCCCLLLSVSPAVADSGDPSRGWGAEVRAEFDPRYARMERTEALFLADLFALTDRMNQENLAVAPWLLSGGVKGLAFEHYSERADDLLLALDALETPARIRELRTIVAEAFRAQRDFFADWSAAMDEGQAFDSQLTSEFGYHAGLHRSQRTLLRAYGRLLALFPDEDEENLRAFYEELRALDLLARRPR